MHVCGSQLYLITTSDDGLDSADMCVCSAFARARVPCSGGVSARVSLSFLFPSPHCSPPISSLSNADAGLSRADRSDMKLFVRRRDIKPLTGLYTQARRRCVTNLVLRASLPPMPYVSTLVQPTADDGFCLDDAPPAPQRVSCTSCKIVSALWRERCAPVTVWLLLPPFSCLWTRTSFCVRSLRT